MVLSRRQAQVLGFIERFLEKRRYPPSYGEIAARFHLRSLGTVHQHVQALERKGYVEKGWNQHRALRPRRPGSAAVRIRLPDGPTIELPRSLVGPGPHVAQRVREGGGPEGARPGDILISGLARAGRTPSASGASVTGSLHGASIAADSAPALPVAILRLLPAAGASPLRDRGVDSWNDGAKAPRRAVRDLHRSPHPRGPRSRGLR